MTRQCDSIGEATVSQ